MGRCLVSSTLTPLRFSQIPRSISLFNRPKLTLPSSSFAIPHLRRGFRDGFCKTLSFNSTEAVLSEIPNQKKYSKVAAESTGPISSNQLLGVVETAAKTGAEVVMDAVNKPQNIVYKGLTDLVTDTDKMSEVAILEVVTKNFKDHLILGEEGGLIGDSSSDYLWCIDPLEFVGGPMCWNTRTFSAAAGGGAFCNGQKIQVSHTDKVEQSLLVTGFGYEHDDAWSTNIDLFKEFTDVSRGVRRLGAAAVDMCHVALGIVEAYWEYRLKPWDMAAGVLPRKPPEERHMEALYDWCEFTVYHYKMPHQASFRFYAKNVFLTYPQCPCPKEQLLELLQSLLQLACQPYYILVARELHEDGNPHLHAMVQCTKKIQTSNSRFFDLTGTNGRIYHPNIEKLHSPTASRQYIQKEGEFVEWGEFLAKGKSLSKNRDELWRGILGETETEEQFFALCKERCPTDYVTKYPQSKTFSRDHYKRERPPYTSPFNSFPFLNEEVKKWAENNILFEPEQRPIRLISLYLEEPSRTGKTAWARSLGRHNYFFGRISFKDYDQDADYNVIDIKYSTVPTELMKNLVGCQRDFHPRKAPEERHIVEEAGGVVSCMDGGKYSVFDRSVLVSNGVLHDKLLERIGPPTAKLKNKGIDFSFINIKQRLTAFATVNQCKDRKKASSCEGRLS
ncbi:hypothetical protein HYC85_028975 [Camellia sinensis]|uniref:CRESS-DNA virus Rep endonuclease domain-containing protein n=1 Tax=Camellia sinensis TaxID=4442 RepID=A0A7J7G0L1_CAMSI|nr:hypothetical protein HYC85_028975 [Camellia sinensis]